MDFQPRVKPFKGLHYNLSLYKSLDSLVCPPYDVISQEEAVLLRESSPYNFCNIILKDRSTYKELGKKFRSWISQKVLIEDKEPCFYLAEQHFKFGSRNMVRYGFLGLLRLDEEGVVFPHEKTYSKPKKDRFQVLDNVKANLSPIFVIYPAGRKDPVGELVKKHSKNRPHFKANDNKGVSYRLWKIKNKSQIGLFFDYFKDRAVLIADGHHRFEVAKSFYKKNKSKSSKFNDLNYLLAYFTPQDKNLLVLPTHRVLKQRMNTQRLKAKLEPYFHIRKHVSPAALSNWLNKRKKFSFGFYQDAKLLSFCLKSKKFSYRIKLNKDEHNLDVVLLHEGVFKERLGLSLGKEDIEYKKDLFQSLETADKLNSCCFIMRSVQIEDVINIAFKGGKLPQKTTYFYPKFLSGLVCRKL